MKETRIIASLFLMAILVGCGKGNEETQIITVDVNASHPNKDLILQDFLDVEYIPLETNDEFVTQGNVMAIGDQYILVKNWINDGDIFVFDRKTGKGVRKINRKGQGSEEYTFINGIVLDEDNNEMFVNCTSMKKIFVYDLFGNFKRSFNHTDGTEDLDVFDYDKDNLIRYDMSIYYKDGESGDGRPYHAIISKQDGSIIRNIPIPFDIVKAPRVQKGDGVAVTSVHPIVPYHNDWLLIETSTDTVYLLKGNKLSPFLVKTPSKEPEILLTLGVLTDRYYFLHTVKKEFDFTTVRGFPITRLMYDKQENAVFNASVLNADYVKKQEMDMTSHPLNRKIAAFQTLTAYQLVEAYENDELKGELKNITAKLNEESNPVIVLMKYKENENSDSRPD
jgi:hypothetical protein